MPVAPRRAAAWSAGRQHEVHRIREEVVTVDAGGQPPRLVRHSSPMTRSTSPLSLSAGSALTGQLRPGA